MPAAATGWEAALWPTPAGTGQPVALQVRSADPAPLTLRLFDATGRVLAQRTAAPAPALALPEAADLPAGLYLLQVTQAGRQRTLRLVRQ